MPIVDSNRLTNVPNTSTKSNWFHPLSKYEPGANANPWSIIFMSASSVYRIVDAASNASVEESERLTSRIFIDAIIRVLIMITVKIRTSNHTLRAGG